MGSTLTLKEETPVPSGDGEGDANTVIILFSSDTEQGRRVMDSEETSHVRKYAKNFGAT